MNDFREVDPNSKKPVDYMVVLNTEAMIWEMGKYLGSPPMNRYGHSATSYGPHMLIFGGWEQSRATNEVVVIRDAAFSGANKK